MSIGSLILVQKGELPILEGFEELVPIDRFQLVIRFGEVDAEDSLAVVAFRSLHLGWLATALFDPSPYGVVVRSRLSLCHRPLHVLHIFSGFLSHQPLCAQRRTLTPVQ